MEDEIINDDKLDRESSPTFEVKKELSDQYEEENDLFNSSNGIFEVIPFIAKLLSNLKCSFYSRNNEIIIAGIELPSVQELIERLIKNKITPNRMDCNLDSTFTLSIDEIEFQKPLRLFNNENAKSIRYLFLMAMATQASNLSIQVERGELHIRSLSYDSLASLMVRLKQVDIRPKQVDSLKDSAFSLVFNPNSFINCSMSANNFSDESPIIVKRGRGRPRIRPKPTDLSLDNCQIKRPRGRPRRSDVVPNIISRANSFINIQPKSLTAQELESCFVRFLESDLCHPK